MTPSMPRDLLYLDIRRGHSSIAHGVDDLICRSCVSTVNLDDALLEVVLPM